MANQILYSRIELSRRKTPTYIIEAHIWSTTIFVNNMKIILSQSVP